jgi:uncharacterized protein YpbB
MRAHPMWGLDVKWTLEIRVLLHKLKNTPVLQL